MKLLLRSAFIAGIAAFAVAGMALAGNLRTRVMTVNLPDGLIARVEYQGEVAPKVTLEPRSPDLAAEWLHPAWVPAAMLDRISADMDRQFDAMFRGMRLLDVIPADDAALTNWTSTQALPAGATRYTYVATTNGKGFCARTFEITSDGPNQKPKVISSTSGDCGASTGPTATGRPAAPAHST